MSETRTYKFAEVCHFRHTSAPHGELSNFFPLPTPVPAGLLTFPTSEHLFQACKFPGNPDLQARIAEAKTPREAKIAARSAPLDDIHIWNRRRANVMRWVIRVKYESNSTLLRAVLDCTGDSPIVENSARDCFWGASPDGGNLVGANVLGRLWMELRSMLVDNHPRAASGHWRERLGAQALGQLYDPPP